MVASTQITSLRRQLPGREPAALPQPLPGAFVSLGAGWAREPRTPQKPLLSPSLTPPKECDFQDTWGAAGNSQHTKEAILRTKCPRLPLLVLLVCPSCSPPPYPGLRQECD